MVQWITHFENAQWRVEINAVVSDVNRFFTWEKSFIRVTWKVAGEIFCYINGEKYNFYNQNEQIILEITDLIRANVGGGGTIEIRDYNNDYLYDLDYESIAGARPSKSNVSSLPSSIPFAPRFTAQLTTEPNWLPFWLQFTDQTESWLGGSSPAWVPEFSGTIFDIYGDRVTSKNLAPTFDTDQYTFRISDTTQFPINETSGVYGFSHRVVDLKKGETYKFSANGNRAGAAIGAKLMFSIYEAGVTGLVELFINNNADTTVNYTFVCPNTATYTIASFYYPNGAPAGTVTVNWYKVELISGAQTRLVDLPCTNEHILFEWTGRFGVKKSWWFKKESVISQATKTINLQTMDSGFNTLKDKNTNLIISHRNADNLTQHYLSDIVLSDEVFCYPDETAASKLQVRVETNSFEVGLNNRDIVLTINKDAYDTI